MDNEILVAQKPAEGVIAFEPYPDLKMFRVPCSCSCDNEFDLMVEVDECGIASTLTAQVKTKYWRDRIRVDYSENWLLLNLKIAFNDWYNRFAVAFTALTTGYVETSVSVIMTEQQTLNFSQILIDSVEAMKKIKEVDETNKEIHAANRAKERVMTTESLHIDLPL